MLCLVFVTLLTFAVCYVGVIVMYKVGNGWTSSRVDVIDNQVWFKSESER